jgi:hypothetical protein
VFSLHLRSSAGRWRFTASTGYRLFLRVLAHSMAQRGSASHHTNRSWSGRLLTASRRGRLEHCARRSLQPVDAPGGSISPSVAAVEGVAGAAEHAPAKGKFQTVHVECARVMAFGPLSQRRVGTCWLSQRRVGTCCLSPPRAWVCSQSWRRPLDVAIPAPPLAGGAGGGAVLLPALPEVFLPG